MFSLLLIVFVAKQTNFISKYNKNGSIISGFSLVESVISKNCSTNKVKLPNYNKANFKTCKTLQTLVTLLTH